MAVLKEIRGIEVQLGDVEHAGWLPSGAATPRPIPSEIVSFDLTIEEADGGVVLVWEGPHDGYCGDTWHELPEHALSQARLWFGVQPDEWADVSDSPAT